MISQFVEIILRIYEAVSRNKSPEKVLNTVDGDYDKAVIIAAYSWIYDKIIKDALSKKSLQGSSDSRRYPSEYELQLIGSDNFNYLKHFCEIGIITNDDLELILNKLIMLPGEVINKNTIDTLIFSLFLDIDSYVLPGSRLLLFSSDKIN